MTGGKLISAFALRLAASLRERAKFLADREGVSLNQFINLAVAEKVSRLEISALEKHRGIDEMRLIRRTRDDHV